MQSWTENIEICGKNYALTFRKRPFREGLEVELMLGEQLIKIAEFGLGREALIEKVTEHVGNYLKIQGL